jgi:2-dehydro-3-deoxyphosphogluconate aldolase/(4S)-4-hydroxy-2-oxoglutarate aldolase
MQHDTVLARLVSSGVVPVIRLDSADAARDCVDWLSGVGFSCFELTTSIPGAFELCAELSGRLGTIVGMGTVLSQVDAERAIDAGARFIVSPCVLPDVAATCAQLEVPCLLGAMTPTEVLHAVRYGASAVKLFPASSCGGAAHVRALKAIFPWVLLVPTGGIGVEHVAEYLGAGASFVGIGGLLVDARAIARGERDRIGSAGREALAQVAKARAK